MQKLVIDSTTHDADKDGHLEEMLDEALEESFPASDAPNFTRGDRGES
jgi:hypothetical protein